MVKRDSVVRQVVVVAALLTSLGCYTLQPVSGQPLPLGTVISLSINDAGRVALGGQMGPEIAEVEGRLLQKDSAHYLVSVEQVRLLRGGEQIWAGERIRVDAAHVVAVGEKKFSRGRTAVLSAAAVGAIAIIFSQGILGSLAGDDGKAPTDTALTLKYPRFGRH